MTVHVKRRGRSLLAIQRWFVIGGGLFLLVILASLFFGARSRQAGVLATGSGQENTATDVTDEGNSKLYLQVFSRVQMKNGKQASHIKGKDAKYYAKEDLTFIRFADLVVFRAAQGPTKITSDSAKLSMAGEALNRADLEGNIVVKSHDGATVKTDVATYSAEEKLVTAPGLVKVEGEGFYVEGVGMDMIVEADVITLHDKVVSRFEKAGTVPGIFNNIGGKSGKKRAERGER